MKRILRVFWLFPTIWMLIDCQLVLEPTDNSLTKKVGEDVAVYCRNHGTSQVQPEWFNPLGLRIGTKNSGGSNHLFVEEDTSVKETKLQIVGLIRDDEGVYTCRLTGTAGQVITIFVFEGIEFTNQEEEQIQAFEEFEAATIKCTVIASPQPTIEWYQDGIRIYPGERYFIDPKVGLTISNITMNDQGTFQCRATIRSVSETEAMDIEVDVQVAPSWVYKPLSEIVAVGSDHKFHCRADGDPQPEYEWTFDNNIIENNDKYEIQDNGEYLIIYNLEKDDDGSYLCVASNGVRAISAVGDLTVLNPPRGNVQDNKTVNELQTVVLQCSVVQGDECILLWERKGAELILGTQPTNSRIVVSEGIKGLQLTLTISGVQRADHGEYICILENEVAISKVSHYVLVEYQPTINTTLTRDEVYSWVGNPVNVSCHWEGYPTPTLIWKRGGWKLNDSDATFFNFGNGSYSALIVPGAMDFGSYVCVATNKINKNEFTVDLLEAYTPTEPLGVTAGERTSTSIEILFEEPELNGGLPIIGYAVQYWGSGTTIYEQDYFNETEEVKIMDLGAKRQYYFRVGAENDVGYGTWSENATAKTLSHRPPQEPKILSPDISDYPNRYELRWREPEDNGGSPINAYVIKYSLVKSTDVEELPARFTEQLLGPDVRVHIISELERDTYYFIQLYAVSVLGNGVPAERIIKTSQGTISNTVKPTSILQTVDTRTYIALIAASFIVLLILVDVCCYCMNDCGLIMCLCVQCCGKHAGTREVNVELNTEYSEDFRDPSESEFSVRKTNPY